jgi:large subunit ribosomal protein L13
MDSLSFKTQHLPAESVQKEWYVIDAKDQVLGRFASQVAMILKGKHKTTYTPNVDCGDNVIIINADKVRFTGKKFTDKVYTRHTGYPGGQRFTTPKTEAAGQFGGIRVMESAVRGMLPKTRLGREMFRNVFVYNGDQHPHIAQNPKNLTF